MKRLMLILSVMMFCTLIRAQDDELPPPSSHPRQENNILPDQPGFQNQGKHKKIDLSAYILEPGLIISFVQGGYNIGISPYVGHRIYKNLYGGGGVTYMYTGFKNIGYQDATGSIHYTNASWNTVGGGLFLQYNIWRGLFVRDRFEVMHRWMDGVYEAQLNLNTQTNTYNISMPKLQKTYPDMLVGVGYNLLQNKNFFMPIMFSYNVLAGVTNKLYSVYPHGWVMQLGFVDVF